MLCTLMSGLCSTCQTRRSRLASALHQPVLDWYAENARTLPWRDPARGLGGDGQRVHAAADTRGSRAPGVRGLDGAVAQAGETWPQRRQVRLCGPGAGWGTPRRALRLHAAAKAIVEQHGGVVPEDHAALLALPGVGTYTAAAIASFAFGQRHAVVDTNVRRVFARALTGAAQPTISPTAADQRLAVSALPADEPTAARWAVATMELGALVCTARSPRCGDCPISSRCAWILAGISAVLRPAPQGPDLRRHRPPGPRPPPRRTTRRHRPSRQGGPRRLLARPQPSANEPWTAWSPTAW